MKNRSYLQAKQTLCGLSDNYLADMSLHNVSIWRILKTRNVYDNIFPQQTEKAKPSRFPHGSAADPTETILALMSG